MKIYTKTGDQGKTSLIGGVRIDKSDLALDVYGTIDELNSYLGYLQSKINTKAYHKILNRIQNQLFVLSAEIATPDKEKRAQYKEKITDNDIQFLEDTIDQLSGKLTPLKSFILPGGSERGAICHIARTVCRRAERLLVKWGKEQEIEPIWLKYLNRLSDLLFVIARYLNKIDGRQEFKWSWER